MLDDLIKERLKKLEEIKKVKLDPYPPEAKRTLAIAEARKRFNALAKSRKKISLVGRILGSRDQGNIVFLDLADATGKLQLVLKKDNLPDFEFWKSVLDIGDFIYAGGSLFKTKKGEESLEVKELKILAKSLRPLPSEWYGLEDIETRLRKRYLDLLMNPEAKVLFEKKAVFWETIRNYLKGEGFLEVETPVLESVPGGADAEPFKTHHNALDVDFYLRISMELSLKKLLVAGFERVFEIGRVFRNEGIDKEHLQDYTHMEYYWAYADYNDMMASVEKMYKAVVKKTCGGFTVTFGGKKINWGKRWPKVNYVEEFKKAAGLDPTVATRKELFITARSFGLQPEENLGRGRLIDLIYKKAIRPKLIEPCFLVDPPVELVPLAKRSRKNPKVAERFQVVACGTEVGNGFSELNDPLDQRARFEEQMKLRAEGDNEAQRLDEDYLEAMEYGMPPAAGFGMSERLFAILMDKPVRETVIFPLMRPKK